MSLVLAFFEAVAHGDEGVKLGRVVEVGFARSCFTLFRREFARLSDDALLFRLLFDALLSD